jgi:hemolysin III
MDHAVIFALIAGTYTPLALLALPQPLGGRLLAAVWLLGLFGVALKLAFGHRYDRFCLILYLAMGWLMLPNFASVAAALGPEGTAWLIGGGIAYTAGIPLFVWDRLPFSNAVWHGFCLVGSAAHFVLIAGYLP